MRSRKEEKPAGHLESFMALVTAYSRSPSCRSISLKVPMQPANKCQYNVITLEVRCVANLPAEFTDSLGQQRYRQRIIPKVVGVLKL